MSSRTRAARVRTSSATMSQSLRFSWNVVSRPWPRATQGVAVTGDRSPPRAMRRYHGPIVEPKRVTSSSASERASWDTVSMPRAASLAEVLRPTPQSASVGRGPMISYQVSAVIV